MAGSFANFITFVSALVFLQIADAQTSSSASHAGSVTIENSLHLGGNVRVLKQDPLQLTDPNADDGNRNFNQGLISSGVALHTNLAWKSDLLEAKVGARLFYDFLLHDGDTDGQQLSQSAINRVGKGAYLRDAWLGLNTRIADGVGTVRLGNQVFNWGESSSLDSQLNMPNPIILSRLWLPGGSVEEARVAIPAVSASWTSSNGWFTEAFHGFAYRAMEIYPNGTFLSGNDYYSPGASRIVTSTGNPFLDAALGTTVFRRPDQKIRTQGSGIQLKTPELVGDLKAVLGVYAGRMAAPEQLASATVGTVLGPPGTFAATSGYYIERTPEVPIVGFSMKASPHQTNQLRMDYSVRRRNPLQVDERELVSGVQLIGGCAATGDPALCGAASANRAVSRQTNGALLDQVTAIGLAGTDISGVSQHNLSQLLVGFTQGLPNFLGTKLVLLDIEHVAQWIGNYDPNLLPLRADRGLGSTAIATRRAATFRIGMKADWPAIGFADAFSVFMRFQHDYHGYAASPRDTIFAGRRILTLGTTVDFARSWSAQAVLYGQLNRRNEADTNYDRRLLNMNLSYKF